MNEPQLLSIHNLVFVDKNPPGKCADKGGNAWIRNIDENGIQVQFTIDGRRRLISPCRILRDANIDTLARQWACASPHVEKHFNQFLEQQFAQQGWLIGYQPPCSPTANGNDDYLFPALSKMVSRSQAINFKARTLSTEKL